MKTITKVHWLLLIPSSISIKIWDSVYACCLADQQPIHQFFQTRTSSRPRNQTQDICLVGKCESENLAFSYQQVKYTLLSSDNKSNHSAKLKVKDKPPLKQFRTPKKWRSQFLVSRLQHQLSLLLFWSLLFKCPVSCFHDKMD